MGDIQTKRTKTERRSAVIGVSLTLAAHAAAIVLVSLTGLKYIYPPPEETSMLIDFERTESVQMEAGSESEPVQSEPIKSEPVQSESPAGPAKPEPDPRAMFPGMAKRDTSLTAGRTDGKPDANVPGRNTIGNLPRPAYDVQESGTVVVTIWIDNYGNVVKAVPGGDGTTVTDKTLWATARKAAMETHFNMDADAPAMQEGTITYIFNLK